MFYFLTWFWCFQYASNYNSFFSRRLSVNSTVAGVELELLVRFIWLVEGKLSGAEVFPWVKSMLNEALRLFEFYECSQVMLSISYILSHFCMKKPSCGCAWYDNWLLWFKWPFVALICPLCWIKNGLCWIC